MEDNRTDDEEYLEQIGQETWVGKIWKMQSQKKIKRKKNWGQKILLNDVIYN